MKSKKITGFIIAVIIIMGILPVKVTASTGFMLGEFTVISENNQQNGWCTNGVDGIETKLYINAFYRVVSLHFDFDTEVDNIVLVCLGDGNNWTWTETPIEVNDKWFSISVNDINGWAEAISGNDVKILLCNYNPSWENIKVTGFTDIPGGPFENQKAWIPKNFKIGSGKSIITAVDFDPDNFEEHGMEYARYTVRPEMAEKKGPQTEVGWSGFGDNICGIDAGEWVQYTAEVTEAGNYNFFAWLAPDAESSGNIEIYVDDVFVGASVDTPEWSYDAKNWFYDIYPAGSIDLTAGTHVIKTVFPKGGVLFSALEIIPDIIETAPVTGDIGTGIIIFMILLLLPSVILFASVKKIIKPKINIRR